MNDPSVIAAIAIPLCVFLFGVYRIVKKDADSRREKVVDQVESCIRENATIKESLKRVHQRVDSVEHSHEKLELTVDSKMDRLHDKLDKIMDILLDRSKQ